MTGMNFRSQELAFYGKQRTLNHAAASRLGVSAGRALLIALLVSQLGLALITTLRSGVDRLQVGLATGESAERVFPGD